MQGKIKASRPNDYAYDSTYTVSHARDLYRDSRRANPPVFERLPNYGNMFSESAVHPSYGYRIKFNPQAAPATFAPSNNVLGGGKVDTVSGTERYKFFQKPVIPYLKSLASDMIHGPVDAQFAPSMGPPEPATRTVGTQSDYRENEAQTDPYTPDYIVREGTRPEILTLASLKYGTSLPAGQAEVEMILRARRRREVEESLPPITDEASLQVRLKMLSDLERMEWDEREQQIKSLQDERLTAMVAALRRREEEREDMSRDRVEITRQVKSEIASKKSLAIHQKRAQTLRKLEKERQEIGADRIHRDVIQEYSDYGSSVYAPLKRDGSNPDAHMKYPEIRPLILESHEGVAHLEVRAENKIALKKPKAPVIGADKFKTLSAKKAYEENINDVVYAAEAIEKKKQREGDEDALNVNELYKATPRIIRPSTPTLGDPELDKADEDKESAAVFLQMVMRGRAVENEYIQGKERCRYLIEELQALQSLAEKEAAGEAVFQRETEADDFLFDEVLDGVGSDILLMVLSKYVPGLHMPLPSSPAHEQPAAPKASSSPSSKKAQLPEIQQKKQVVDDFLDNLFEDVITNLAAQTQAAELQADMKD